MDNSLTGSCQHKTNVLLLLGMLNKLAPLFLIIAILAISQGVVWGIIVFPQLGLYFAILFLLFLLFVVNIEYGVLAIVLVVPWSWQSMSIQVGLVSIKASYALISIGFAFLLFEILVTRTRKWVKTPLDIPLLIFVAVNLLSIIISIEPFWSLRETLQVILYVLFYFLATNVFQTKKSVIRAINVVIAATALTALLGLFGATGYSTRTEGFSRMLAGFTDANLSANYLLVGLPSAFSFIVDRGKKLGTKLPHILATIVLLVGLLSTYSRAGWVVAVAVMLLVSFLSKLQIKGVAIIVITILVFALFGAPSIHQRASQIGSIDDSSTLGHLYLWKCSLAIVKEHPVTGIGAGAFPRYFDKYSTELPPPEIFGNRVYFNRRGGYGVPAHNALLQVWAELGTIGLLAFLAIIGLFAKIMISAIRKVKDGQSIVLLAGLFASAAGVFIHNLSITNLIEHFWLALGIAVAGLQVVMLEERMQNKSFNG